MPIVNYDWDEDEDNIVEEYDDTGATVAEYTTEPDQFGDVLSQYRDGQESFYHTDGQGSTLAITNANGSVTDIYAYSSFGEVTAQTGSTVNPFQYIGRKQYCRDEETADLYVRRRSLITTSGMWCSADPLSQMVIALSTNELVRKHLQALKRVLQHSYIYVHNRPVSLYDPMGLICAPATEADHCIECVRALKDEDAEFKKLLDILDKLNKDPKRKADQVPCRYSVKCCNKDDDGFLECEDCINKDKLFGRVLPVEKEGRFRIILCADRLEDLSKSTAFPKHGKCGKVRETLIHEMVHVVDRCYSHTFGLTDLFPCQKCICEELRAYWWSGQCKKGSWWFDTFAGQKPPGNPFASEADCAMITVSAFCQEACGLPDFGSRENQLLEVKKIAGRCEDVGKAIGLPPLPELPTNPNFLE